MTSTTGKTKGSGGNGKSVAKKDVKKLAEKLDLKLPDAISNYMTGSNLPKEYAFISVYVESVRNKMIDEAGGELSQLQTIVLDGICEVLMVLKYISCFLGEDPATTLVTFNKFGVPYMSDVAIRGFSGLHQVLDKKIKQFHDLTETRGDKMSAREVHRRAITGSALKTGRPEGSQSHNKRE